MVNIIVILGKEKKRVKRTIIKLWSILDPIYYSCSRLQSLEQITGHPNIFRVRLTRYRGRDVNLSDGTLIKKNDFLVKIHLHNVRILSEMQNFDDFKKSLFLYNKVKESLPDLARYISHHKNHNQIKGIIGISFIDKGYKRFGFESFPCTNFSYIWFKRIALYPIHLLSRSENTSKKKKIPTPQYLFMSKNTLCKKYSSIENVV